MRYLIDTHVIIWSAQGSDILPQAVRDVIVGGDCAYSTASLWEIAIKIGRGKLDSDFTIPELDQFCRQIGMTRLRIEPEHLETLKTLPDIHRDPFDRLLIAQAQAERLIIVTCDSLIPKYPVQTLW